MESASVKACELTPALRLAVCRQLVEWLRPVGDGCLTPRNKTATVKVTEDGPRLSLRRATWMLAYGETPSRYLRTTCRTVGCCCIDHLTDDPSTNVRINGLHEGRTRYYMTAPEQREAYRLRFEERVRITDIAKRLKFAFSTVQRAIERERQLRKAEADHKRAHAQAHYRPLHG
jgi:hypothetical protein